MSKQQYPASILALVLFLSFPLVASAELDGWLTSWKTGEKTAKQKQAPLVVIFAHEGCPQCEKMDHALATRKVRTALRNAVKVYLEYTDNASLASRFDVRVTPTLLVFSPATGFDAYIYREEGAMAPRDITVLARTVDSMTPKDDKCADAKPGTTTKPEDCDKQPQQQKRLGPYPPVETKAKPSPSPVATTAQAQTTTQTRTAAAKPRKRSVRRKRTVTAQQTPYQNQQETQSNNQASGGFTFFWNAW